jgi:hypothetical protein
MYEEEEQKRLDELYEEYEEATRKMMNPPGDLRMWSLWGRDSDTNCDDDD